MLQVDYVEFYSVLIGVTSAREVIMSMSDEVAALAVLPRTRRSSVLSSTVSQLSDPDP